jgi:hypothetical protein
LLVKFLIDISLKGAVLIGFAGLTALAMHRQSASMRSLVWAFALAAVVLLPVVTVLTPMWEVPILPNIFARPDIITELPDDALVDETGAALGISSQEKDLGDADSLGGLAGLGLSWLGWATLAWMVGGVVFLGWFLTGKGVLWWICTKADTVKQGPWNALLRQICAELGISRRVRLFRSHHATVAFTSGIRQPALILPAAADGWTEESVRLVMLHELAHVKRWDTLTEVLAQIATILYWFHPLVWLAAHWFRVERERACDDMVLNSGSKPSEYASQLMEVARSLGLARRPLWQAAAISQGSSLKNRLMFILDPTQKRTSGHRMVSGMVAVLMIALILPLAAFTPWTPAPGSDGIQKGMPVSGQGEVVKKTLIWGPGEIPRHTDLASKLLDSDGEVRKEAARALATIGDEPALKVLRAALESSDPGVATTAMKQLALIGDPPSVAFFIKALESEDPEVRLLAALDLIWVLASENKKGRKIAKIYLRSEGDGLPVSFMKALQGGSDKTRNWAGRMLPAVLSDESQDVRIGVLESLSRARDPQFADAFAIVLKKDSDPKMRYHAVKALADLPKMRNEDFKLLIDTLLGDEHPGVRGLAALALGKMGDKRAMKPLEKALSDKDEKVRDSAKKALTLLKEGQGR